MATNVWAFTIFLFVLSTWTEQELRWVLPNLCLSSWHYLFLDAIPCLLFRWISVTEQFLNSRNLNSDRKSWNFTEKYLLKSNLKGQGRKRKQWIEKGVSIIDDFIEKQVNKFRQRATLFILLQIWRSSYVTLSSESKIIISKYVY